MLTVFNLVWSGIEGCGNLGQSVRVQVSVIGFRVEDL
jgi:hypothetical protein